METPSILLVGQKLVLVLSMHMNLVSSLGLINLAEQTQAKLYSPHPTLFASVLANHLR